MIIVDGIEVKGCIVQDRSKKDVSASGKVRERNREIDRQSGIKEKTVLN